MRHRRRVLGLQPDRQTDTARRAFVELAGVAEAHQRATQIAALPVVEFKGRQLYTLRCNGETGRGPHDQNVPESLLWSLLSLNGWRCPFHA